MRMRLSVALFLAGVAAATVRAEAPPLQGTLPEDYLPALRTLLRVAVERSPNTINAGIAVDQQAAAKLGAFSALYPSLSVSGSYAVSKESSSNSSPSTSKGLFYNVGVGQTLFEWGAVKNAALIGSLGEKIAERQYADAYRQLAIMIREQYMMLIYKKIQLRNDNFKLKLAQEDLDAQQVRFEAGSSSAAELQGFHLAVDTAALARDRTEDDFAYQMRQFTRLVGIDAMEDQSIPTEIPHPEFSESLADAVLAGFVGDGIESTFQSQVYEMLIKEQDLSYKIAKVRLLPRFSASAGYSYENYIAASTGNVSQIGIQSETYGISAGWTLFDGFATRSAKLSALAAKRTYEQQLKTYTDTTLDSVTYMRHQLGFSARALALAEIHYNRIDDQVKRLNGDKALGYASQATIDAGILTLDATDFDQALARSDYLSHWTEFISMIGIDPALDNIPSHYVR
jgi:outer membrane protein TolC